MAYNCQLLRPSSGNVASMSRPGYPDSVAVDSILMVLCIRIHALTRMLDFSLRFVGSFVDYFLVTVVLTSVEVHMGWIWCRVAYLC